MNITERIDDLKNRWFLMEPAYFMVLCTHRLEINHSINTDIASGGGYVYINDTFFEDKSDKYFDEKMKAEMLRILLKHPYQRQLPNRVKMLLSSNFVIGNNTKFTACHFSTTEEKLSGGYNLLKASLEEIYDNIRLPESNQRANGEGNPGKSGGSSNGNLRPNTNKSKNKSDKSEKGNGNNENDHLNNFDDGCNSTDDAIEKTRFWKEDDFFTTEINNIIGKIDKTSSWGNMPGNLVDEIKKSIEPKFNYKAIFQQFRSTVISSSRTITRMKPNRRFGYAMPGSKRNFITKILVAVDTSGSISDEDLQLALGFIKGFFKYGISEINIIEFDTSVKRDSKKVLSKAPKTFEIKGRGGTDFNDIFKYTMEEDTSYDGVIIVTDGYASVPNKKWLKQNYRHTKYLWCLNSEAQYNNFKHYESTYKDFLKFGKATYVDKKSK